MADDRLANLLGVTALAAADRLRSAAAEGVGHAGAAPAALVHLQAHPGGSIEALSRVLEISQPATVRLAARLEDEGLVERRPGRDRRTLALFVTEHGSATADRFLAERASALGALLDALSDSEQEQLAPLLERLVSALADDRPGALTACRLCDRQACTRNPGCPLQHTVPAA
jgi:MarR family transcriptional repressor of emrRAB